jgi:sulfite exporter TauE/SafE
VSAALVILAASLLGSLHCAAMCGGFVCFYATGLPAGRAPLHRAAPHAAYNVGRLVSYVLLGAVAGALGAQVDRAGALAGVSRLAAIVAGTLMVIWGASTVLAVRGIALPSAGAPRRVQAWFATAIHRLRDRPPAARALATGLLTTLLPCGWLYTFVVTAGGTGSATRGAFVMLLFWAGTLPMMVGVGLGAQAVFGPLRRRLPVLTAATVVVMGLFLIVGRVQLGPRRAAHAAHAVPATPER